MYYLFYKSGTCGKRKFLKKSCIYQELVLYRDKLILYYGFEKKCFTIYK